MDEEKGGGEQALFFPPASVFTRHKVTSADLSHAILKKFHLSLEKVAKLVV